MTTLFYFCPLCGNIVTKIENGGPIPHCCGQQMEELRPGTIEASAEKHIPVLEKADCNKFFVKVGSEPHPMTSQHYIKWIWIESVDGGQLRYLSSKGNIADKASVEFQGCADDVLAVYAYCNIHGLWKCDVASSQDSNCNTGCSINK